MTERESGKFAAIVLAAGAGVRFGGGKLLAPFRGRPLIAGALATALAAPVIAVVVAIRDDPELEAAILALDLTGRTRLVRVEGSAEGLGTSLATAARALPADLDGVLVFLGDMPRVGAEIATALIRALTGRDGVVAPRHAGRRGHPVLFGGDWLPALRDLGGDVGAQALIRQAGARFTPVETDDPGVLFDVDRPEDLTAAP
jgi:molybdenum cofactor cytidylyltransferase